MQRKSKLDNEEVQRMIDAPGEKVISMGIVCVIYLIST